MPIFATERLDIRPWTREPADLDVIFDIYGRWDVARWLGVTPRALANRGEAGAMVDRWAQRSTEDGRLGIWAIEVRDTGATVGTVLLVPVPPDRVAIEVGWQLHPDAWGHGLATEAARGAIEHGFGHGVTEIHAFVRPGNDRSLAVCERLGLPWLERSDRWYGTEMEVFRVTRSEWGA